MKPLEFQKIIQVTSADLDAQNHVNNLRYMAWVLEISELHWVDKTDQATRDQYAWFVVEHHIKYKKQAFQGDRLRLKTWVESCSRASSIRRVAIIREDDQSIVAEAKSTWVFIDRTTQKPTPITKPILKAFFETNTE